ncbi:MAG: hypothetical protein K8G79_10650 [bacterium]|uniref:Uncharacterized protein n=1 Tax=Candidatus Methylomirabilis tolerans TaxID=3123416 RepID=A0AAJ1EK16_9BACT|nr:hypothetical protein [Candidatus Methylomirabilis sp.]
MKSALVLTMALFAPNLAASQKNFAISGAGTISCGKFLEYQENSMVKEVHVTWLQGF